MESHHRVWGMTHPRSSWPALSFHICQCRPLHPSWQFTRPDQKRGAGSRTLSATPGVLPGDSLISSTARSAAYPEYVNRLRRFALPRSCLVCQWTCWLRLSPSSCLASGRFCPLFALPWKTVDRLPVSAPLRHLLGCRVRVRRRTESKGMGDTQHRQMCQPPENPTFPNSVASLRGGKANITILS